VEPGDDVQRHKIARWDSATQHHRHRSRTLNKSADIDATVSNYSAAHVISERLDVRVLPKLIKRLADMEPSC